MIRISLINPVCHLDVTEESISQPLALTGALDQAGDVGDVEEGGHLAGGLVVLNQPVEPGVGNRNPSLVRVDCAEREVFCSRNAGLGENIEECGLSDIGETNDATLEIGPHATNQDHLLLFYLLFRRHLV